jgi:hypothetical protein
MPHTFLLLRGGKERKHWDKRRNRGGGAMKHWEEQTPGPGGKSTVNESENPGPVPGRKYYEDVVLEEGAMPIWRDILGWSQRVI